MLISPFTIFASSGNSSSEVALKKRPYLFNLTSSGNNLPSLFFRLSIVRNFINLNIFSSFPGRSCIKKGFPLINTIPSTININNTGESTIKAIKLNEKSIILFRYFSYILFLHIRFNDYSKHALITSIILSCCSAVILLSLGRHNPLAKISIPTSATPPAIYAFDLARPLPSLTINGFKR